MHLLLVTQMGSSSQNASSLIVSIALFPRHSAERRSTWLWRNSTSSQCGDYDLIVVDTPPSRNALDFLDAPERLLRLLNNRVFRIITAPARTGFRAAGVAVQTLVRAISRVIGTEVVDDIVAFFRAFEGMEEGFRERAMSVRAHR